MAPKKGGKGKKKKAPAFYTAPEDTEPFGFRVHDIVRTPVGLTGTVIGVKYDDPERKETGRLWVEYPGGKQAPLEPRLGAGFIGTLGYRRAPEAEHIRRDVNAFNTEMSVMETKRKEIEERTRLYREALDLAENNAGKKGKKSGGNRPQTR